jgi:CheY-like chemotaxis protein
MSFEVLVVDDDAGHARHILSVVEAMGAKATSASTQMDALNTLKATRFDLVVFKTDLVGITERTVANIRDTGQPNARSPFIGIAQNVGPTQLRSYLQAGYFTALPRPVQAWRLREAIYLLGLTERPLSAPPDTLRVLGALASEFRLKLYGAIARHGPVTSTGLEGPMGVRRQNFDHHLEALEEAGLIIVEMRGRAKLYQIRTATVQAGTAFAGHPTL